MFIDKWITHHTIGAHSVLEFGAGVFGVIKNIHASVPWRGGIEVFEPYIQDSQAPEGTVHLCGDMRNWRNLVPDSFVPDVAMFIDSLEHITMDEAKALIEDVKQDFNKILLFIPVGDHPQTKDAWGYGNDHYQTHRATWTPADVESMGFTITHAYNRMVQAIWVRP